MNHTPPTLEQIATPRTDKRRAELRGKTIVVQFSLLEEHARQLERELATLQTATKQPEGADWADSAAKECCEFSEKWYRGPGKDLPDGSFGENMSAIIRKHAPLVDEQAAIHAVRCGLKEYYAKDRTFEQVVEEIMSALLSLVANREDSERDSKRLDWLEKYAEDLFRDRAPDANGGWFCVRETFPQSKDKPFGEFVCKAGNTLRAAIDAAMRPTQPERGQGEGTP